ncbi:helicase-related protein [Ralstonia sp.]|uniref:DEAD/DEAH box helicase n=1 Tax=Ralstonia sp. TaxID=54061 RepID=UPI00257F4916|nr:helicase-related protein [Ralstonia sp.]
MTVHRSRGYQVDVFNRSFAAWRAGAKVVMPVMPTGGGKTHLVARVVESFGTPAACIAHRAELVGQMSTALAREGIRHRVIGPDSLRRACTQLHMAEFGRAYYDPTSPYAVAGVDTLVRMPENDPWFKQVGLWVIDEGHHLLRKNKWGKAAAMFVNARGYAPTATPWRADGCGLGSHADGLVDEMVEGPSMRAMIDAGYLTDYTVACPPSDIDLSAVKVTDSGDYSPEQLKAARRKSHITGDVVSHYLKFARGKLGVTFDTDIESATETCAAFRAAGVPAEVVTGKTPDALRASILRSFRAREVLQLVNVDLFGEGFDLPAIEVVSMARPTQSFSLYCQQFGRALRLMVSPELMAKWETFSPEERKAHIAASGKPRALILDHVGNIVRHKLPDRPRVWSLDARERRTRSAPDDAIPLRVCENPACNKPFERVEVACPYCATVPTVAERSRPEFVDGDLQLLDPAVLAAMRGEIDRIDGDAVVPWGAPQPAQFAARKAHAERQNAQESLRKAMAVWGGWQTAQGRGLAEAQRRFFHQFHIDVGTAQALGAREADTLAERICDDLNRKGVSI